MPIVNNSEWDEARKQYQRKFGKNSVKYVKHWQPIKNKETLVLLQEKRELKEQIKLLKLRLKAIDKKLEGKDVENVSKPRYYKKNIYIYVLRLEDGFWYVGTSRNVANRFKRHVAGKGANWTKLHKPIEIHEVIDTETNDDREACLMEDQKTFEFAEAFGIDKVRGGGYCQTKPRWPEHVVRKSPTLIHWDSRFDKE